MHTTLPAAGDVNWMKETVETPYIYNHKASQFTLTQRFLEHERFLIFHVIKKKRKYSRWKSETTHEFCTFRAFLKAAVRNAFSIVESRRSTAALITSLNVPVSGGTVCQATPV
jgi:hypothetical protein